MKRLSVVLVVPEENELNVEVRARVFLCLCVSVRACLCFVCVSVRMCALQKVTSVSLFLQYFPQGWMRVSKQTFDSLIGKSSVEGGVSGTSNVEGGVSGQCRVVGGRMR